MVHMLMVILPIDAYMQRVICSLGYNHMPGYCYNVSKDRPLVRADHSCSHL